MENRSSGYFRLGMVNLGFQKGRNERDKRYPGLQQTLVSHVSIMVRLVFLKESNWTKNFQQIFVTLEAKLGNGICERKWLYMK